MAAAGDIAGIHHGVEADDHLVAEMVSLPGAARDGEDVGDAFSESVCQFLARVLLAPVLLALPDILVRRLAHRPHAEPSAQPTPLRSNVIVSTQQEGLARIKRRAASVTQRAAILARVRTGREHARFMIDPDHLAAAEGQGCVERIVAAAFQLGGEAGEAAFQL